MISIKPCDIDTSNHFWGTFCNMETETSANYVVRLCQEMGDWLPFSLEDINLFYKRNKDSYVPDFTFNHLVIPSEVLKKSSLGPHPLGVSWIVQDENGDYHVTDDFILRCYQASPVNK